MRAAVLLGCLVGLLGCDDEMSPGALAEPLPACGPLAACGCAAPPCSVSEPTLAEAVVVVPGDDMPREVESQPAHNNLDIVWHEDRLFFAFRTAPNHFASADAVLYVVSTADHRSWRFEGRFHRERDLREPRFVSIGGRLLLYFAQLGTNPLSFEPGGSLVSEYQGPGQWTEPRAAFPDGFIPWRIHVEGGVARLIGYTGGENIYTADAEPLAVHWYQSRDGVDWTPVVQDQPVVLTGGVSETDFVLLDDGSAVAVGRNEAGDEGGFGSRVCRSEPGAPGSWRCANDPRKYDSPLMFRHGDEVYLVGRRNVTETGYYDLGLDELPPERRWARYQAEYWNKPKRCALWRVDPDALTVAHVLDLPSSGDTCFASVLPLADRQYLLYNYSSPFEKPALTWLQGQTGETFIYRITLTLP